MALDGLRELIDQPEAVWTSSLQRDAVMAVLNTEKDVLAILTTSSGKSMLALIPSLLEDNLITVLILPLKSLITDYKRKLDKMHLRYLHYTGKTVSRGYCTPNLVLVSVDLAREEHWKQWIAEVDTIKTVRRFAFDEGHSPLTDAKFRDSMRDIFMIRSLPRQLVVFSGTISPACEPTIRQMFMLHPDVQVFRSPCTNRPELQLIKAPPQPKTNVIEAVGQLWTTHAATFRPEQRALVFVPFIDLGRSIATHLDCEFYNSQDPDRIKESIYLRWRDGTHNVMVSTSAFSCGNDYAHIPLVLHAGTPREMMGYIQEISRGGRDQHPTCCYLLPISQWSSASSTELDALLGVKEMAEVCFGSNKDCIRYAITKYNDGRGVRCGDDPKDVRCSGCLPTAGLLFPRSTSHINPFKRKATDDVHPVKAKKLIKLDEVPMQPVEAMSDSMKETWDRIQKATQAISARHMEAFEGLQSNLNLIAGQCAMCFWMDTFTERLYQEGRHEFKRCPFHQSHSGPDYIRFKNLIHYNGNTHHKICYICHVPNFGEKLHGPFGGPQGCRYLDIVLPTLYCGFINKKEALEKEFSVSYRTIDQYAYWLCGKLVNADDKSNLISAYKFICNKLLM